MFLPSADTSDQDAGSFLMSGSETENQRVRAYVHLGTTYLLESTSTLTYLFQVPVIVPVVVSPPVDVNRDESADQLDLV